ncbi:MAG: AAA family ATPase [bacterium]
MHLSKIELRDWKAYASTDFEFSAPANGRNVVLIGAPNGYGKTSLYQAIILCLFGQGGPILIENPTLSVDPGWQAAPEMNIKLRYNDFMKRALHTGAINMGRTQCSVKLIFINNNGPIEILRTWHFNGDGEFQPDDEEVRIFVGPNRQPLSHPHDVTTSAEKSEWYQEYISQSLLSRDIAPFFVFDGEQVRAFADREMKQQVLIGIEGLLGIPLLRSLSNNLAGYVSIRLQRVPNVTDGSTKKAQSELKNLENKREKCESRLADASRKLAECTAARNKVTEELTQIGVGSQTLSEKHRKLAEIKNSIKECGAKLEEHLSEDFALALFGAGLRKRLKNRMKSENIRAKWESAKNQGDGRIEDFLSAIDREMDNIVPPVSGEQQNRVVEIVRREWRHLWFPEPPNCAKSYMHSYLTEHQRTDVANKIDVRNRIDAASLIELPDQIDANERTRKRIEDEIARQERIEPEANAKLEELRKLNPQIANLEKSADALNREKQALDGEFSAKSAEVARLLQQIDSAKPAMRRTERARAVAKMVNEIVRNSMPSQIAAIAEKMTDAHRAIAHKDNLVSRIEIAEDGDVKLLNEDGNNVRSSDLSAGEEQIFTQSLFSAVSAVSQRAFPLVVDTPLSRLDNEHRIGVLKHLAQRGQQVILLSTDTEVVGPYLQAIDAYVQEKYLIEFNADGTVGRSAARLGYFSDTVNAQ